MSCAASPINRRYGDESACKPHNRAVPQPVVRKFFQRQTKEPTAMSNALVKDQLTNIERAAREDANFEKILKFKKGEFSIQEEPIPLGTEYLAHTAAWTKCWIKFADRKVEDRKVYRVALGEKPPEREDLDDLDQDEWPEGLDGKPSDPWVFQFLLPLENIGTGEVVIFCTASIGGRTAVANLCTAYVKRWLTCIVSRLIVVDSLPLRGLGANAVFALAPTVVVEPGS